MVLAPPKQIITPRCDRCGLLRREYIQANRRRLGVGWLHGACNCCGCAATGSDKEIVADITGWSQCMRCAISFDTPDTVTLNGSYTLPWSHESGGINYYILDTGTAITLRRWNSSSCTGSITFTTSNNLMVGVGIRESDCLVTCGGAWCVGPLGNIARFFGISSGPTLSGTTATLTNANDCPTTGAGAATNTCGSGFGYNLGMNGTMDIEVQAA